MHKPLTESEKTLLAGLVAANTPLTEICEVIGRDRWTTRRNINYLARRSRPEPKRSPLRLSLAEREEISRGVAAGESLRAIARRLGRAPSTVSREISSQWWRSSLSGRRRGPGSVAACSSTEAGEGGDPRRVVCAGRVQ